MLGRNKKFGKQRLSLGITQPASKYGRAQVGFGLGKGTLSPSRGHKWEHEHLLGGFKVGRNLSGDYPGEGNLGYESRRKRWF